MDASTKGAFPGRLVQLVGRMLELCCDVQLLSQSKSGRGGAIQQQESNLKQAVEDAFEAIDRASWSGAFSEAASQAARLLPECKGTIGHQQRGDPARFLAKYAVVALLDEAILVSDLPVRDLWLNHPLQLHHFNDLNAGEQFYSLLEILETEDSRVALEILEVFYVCLALGFTGKHSATSKDRSLLISDLHSKLSQSQIGAKSNISPAGLPRGIAGGLDSFPPPAHGSPTTDHVRRVER